MSPLHAKKIFVIDDTAFMRAGLIKFLVELGCDKSKIVQFEHGLEARTKMQENPDCDLILCDWNMPQMTGIELLKWVRSDAHWQRTPFILITTESERDKVVEAIQFKVNGYILKPVGITKLQETLDNVFGEGESDDEE